MLYEIESKEIVVKGLKFIWFRGRLKSKFDRFFVNNEWIEVEFIKRFYILKRGVFDYCSIMLLIRVLNWGSKFFRLLDSWKNCLRIMGY